MRTDFKVARTALLQQQRRRFYQPIGPSCLSFWYHMHGHNVGQLYVYPYGYPAIHPLWVRDGNYGDLWQYAQIEVPTVSEVRTTINTKVRRHHQSAELSTILGQNKLINRVTLYSLFLYRYKFVMDILVMFIAWVFFYVIDDPNVHINNINSALS